MKIRKVMECSKGNGQNSSSSSDDTHRPCLSRHALHPTNTRYSHCAPEVEDIKVGSFYEIDTAKLAPETPEPLKSIRVVMVNEKSPLKISLRFPSIYSVRTHLKEGSGSNPDGKKLPALDEKFVIGSGHAAKVLSRRIPSQELADQRNSWGFWVRPSMAAMEGSPIPADRPTINRGVRISVPKKGRCLSELLGTGMVQWGKRRQVRFLQRHEETILNGSSNDVKDRDEEKEEMKKDEEEEENKEEENREEEMEESDDPDDDVDDKTVVMESSTRVTRSKLRKRKRHCSTTKKAKKPKLENQKQIQVYQSRRKMVKSCIDRWSADRYKLAEMNMLKILKAKGAVFGNPILRPALRAEARKLIGDTGLLDHLLKHMAGKVAPGGVERFRRRHNADGAMEYWLESAELVNIRKEAGVQDPYWTPPPGWKPGDNPTMDPACAGELRELKEELAEMRREMKALVSKKQCDNQIIVSPPSQAPCEYLEAGSSSMLSKQKMYAELVRKKAIVEEQLVKISESLSDMEETMKKLKSREEDESGTRGAVILPNLNAVMSEEERKVERDKEAGEKEGKAAKIERLKSGFRLWKAEGSFVWPDMGMMSSVSFTSPSPGGQAVVPTLTPPSSTLLLLPPPPLTLSEPQAQALQFYGPLSQTSPPPLKPVAQRGAIPINVSSALTGPIPSPHATSA